MLIRNVVPVYFVIHYSEVHTFMFTKCFLASLPLAVLGGFERGLYVERFTPFIKVSQIQFYLVE
jgi:hypothetical protein